MVDVMITKLLPPRFSGELMERPRLLEALAGNRGLKLIVVIAPAGYGKTVAILQYINFHSSPFVWYQLDAYDNDPAVFIQYLITGFQKHFPNFGTIALHRATQGNICSSLRFIVVAIVNELAGLSLAGRELVLVLDDYHQISAPVIHQFMEELLEHLPAGIRIVIIGRKPPAFPFSRFQVNDELALIDRDTLRFNASEISEFLTKKQIRNVGSKLQALINKTDGWPAALKLLTGAAGKDLNLVETEIKYVYEYLANEVFDRQPEAIREFLLSAAVLDTITPEMCDLLLGWNGSRAMLDFLEKQQLFLIPLAGSENAYRYHQLFRDFLLERLGTRKNSLWRKAGEIALHNGNLDQAMEYYLVVGDDLEILPMLHKAGQSAFRQGKWQTVVRWLDKVSPEQFQFDPWLAFFRAQIKIHQGKTDEADSWINKSKALFSRDGDPIGIAECQFLQARILNGYGRHQESLTILKKAYPILKQATPFSRFDLPLEMAITLFRNDRYQEAENLLTQSLQEAEERNEFLLMAHFLEGLGHTYYLMGEHSKALQYYQKGMRISPTQSLLNYNFQDLVASIYQEWGELDIALEYAEKSVVYKENLGLIETLPSAYYQLGCIYTDFGELKQAEEIYRKGIALTENGGERYFLSLNKAYLARCLGFQGRLVDSQAMAEQALTEAETQSERLLASCRVICAPVFIQNGNIPKAKSLLQEAVPLLEHWHFAVPLSYGYATLAVLLFKTGDLNQAGELSKKLLDLTSRKNLIKLFLTIPEYQPILRYGLIKGIEISYIQRVLVRMRERGLILLKDAVNHPDPEVRMRTISPLTQINNPDSRELLELLSNDPFPEVRKILKHYTNLSGDTGFNPFKENEREASKSEPKFFRKPDTDSGNLRQEYDTGPFLQLRMLGPSRIILHHRDITTHNWRFIKSRDLLLYLCHQGQPVHINQILEDLWPEFPTDKSMKSFYSVLYWLRKSIQKDVSIELVAYASKTCTLHSSVYMTDRDRFISLINTGSGNIDRNMDALEEAVALYQGEYLSQLDYPWVIPEREHLKRLYLETVICLAKFYYQNQNYQKTVEILSPVVEENPLREEVFSLLISSYANIGDKLAVIRQYQKLKANLLEELGLEPTPEIKKLYYQLCGPEKSIRIT